MGRSQEWLDEFGHLLEIIEDDDLKELVLNGDVEICPSCSEMSAYAYQDTTAYDEIEGDIIPGGFKPKSETIAHISTCSGFEWQCGHCGLSFTTVDSPINHPAYTHADD